MNWFGWLLIAYWAVNALGSLTMIDRPREPLSPDGAVLMLGLYAFLIWGTATVGTAS